MMKYKLLFPILLGVFAIALLPSPAHADGIILPNPSICLDHACPPPPCKDLLPCPVPPPSAQLTIRYHHVTVRLQDQLAVTHVDQVFYNPNPYPVEGTYMFPIPREAAVSSFTLWIDGEPVQAQLLDAEQARQKYHKIVRNLKDPALLEYADQGAMQAHIFPIPPQGERRIELEYTQALAADNGLVRYVYPLNTEKFSTQPIESVSINIDVRASAPIRAVYSPSQDISISRENENHVSVGYEASNVLPDSNFTLYYSLGEEQALHLMTYRDPSDPLDADGFFMLLLAPRPDAASQPLPKDVILVLDRSGSMEGEKFGQAKAALRYILKHLNPEDRFNMIAFSTGVEAFSPMMHPAADVDSAVSWLDQLGAQGSTDINRALLEAASLSDPERPTYLIFLTDGLPTTGVIDRQEILDNFAVSAPKNLSLFAFGVGYDVDTSLLDSLAQSHHGSSTYVLPGEQLDEILSSFYARISTPILTNLSLDFGKVSTYDIFPQPLPDLFAGSQIIIAGRYHTGGRTDVTLSGQVDGQTQTFDFPQQSFDIQTQPGAIESAIPRLWATRKIGFLLSQIRLDGPDQETIDQIVHLSIRFGIVTPFTSYLVTDSMPLGVAEQQRIAGEQLRQLQSMPTAPVFGPEAVQKAADQGALSAAEAPVTPGMEAQGTVRILGARTYVLSNDVWTDTAFDPEKMKTVKVAFLSDDYFALVNSDPDLAAAFSLGQRVISILNGTAYEVIDEGIQASPIRLPATPTPDPADLSIQKPTRTPSIPSTTSTYLPCWGGLIPIAVLAFIGWVFHQRHLHF